MEHIIYSLFSAYIKYKSKKIQRTSYLLLDEIFHMSVLCAYGNSFWETIEYELLTRADISKTKTIIVIKGLVLERLSAFYDAQPKELLQNDIYYPFYNKLMSILLARGCGMIAPCFDSFDFANAYCDVWYAIDHDEFYFLKNQFEAFGKPE